MIIYYTTDLTLSGKINQIGITCSNDVGTNSITGTINGQKVVFGKGTNIVIGTNSKYTTSLDLQIKGDATIFLDFDDEKYLSGDLKIKGVRGLK
jgi:hypothetical protein